MRALGVDVGTVRVGLALSVDRVAVPAQTLRVGNGVEAVDAWAERVAKRVAAAAEERACDVVVVGLPRGMSGRDTASTQRARKVGAALRRYGREVVLFDERLSTVQADRALAQAGRSGVERRQEVDQVAASIILQAWLDTQEA